MHKTFTFQNKNYNDEGIDIRSGKLFLEVIAEWEQEFQRNFSPYKATHLLSNFRTMSILDSCFDDNGNYKCGMDIHNGEINVDEELKVDEHAKMHTIYAIGSGLSGNEDEALFLVTDNDLADGVVLLKYIPDNDDENAEDKAPVNILKKVRI